MEIEGLEIPEGVSPYVKPDIKSFTINGKPMQYDAVMQRKINAIHVLKNDGIISDKEYYILRHRIMRASNEVPATE